MVTKIYANAVAKYNEGKLLDTEKLYRLADSDYAGAVKILCEYGYGGGTSDEYNYDADAFISGEISKLIDYAVTSSPDENLSRVLTNAFLYGNAKAYAKARFSGTLNESALYTMDDGEIRGAIERGEYALLPKFMSEALVRLETEFAGGKADPKLIDIALTEAMYADSLYAAKKSGSKALVRFVTGDIDLHNILAALRARALKVGENSLSEMVLGGGALSEEKILEIYRAEDPIAIIAETRYDYLTEGLTGCDVPALEARSDRFLYEIWQKGSENMLSLSPFVNYFLAQLAEYKTVKMILVCLKNNARQEIFSRLGRAAQ